MTGSERWRELSWNRPLYWPLVARRLRRLSHQATVRKDWQAPAGTFSARQASKMAMAASPGSTPSRRAAPPLSAEAPGTSKSMASRNASAVERATGASLAGDGGLPGDGGGYVID